MLLKLSSLRGCLGCRCTEIQIHETTGGGRRRRSTLLRWLLVLHWLLILHWLLCNCRL